jgi:hypothetical protein
MNRAVCQKPNYGAAQTQSVMAAAFLALVLVVGAEAADTAVLPQHVAGHPRLYLTAADLPRLKERRTQGVHELIWANLTASADWCRSRSLRSEWIPTLTPDPIYENLYDRFYAAMHDAAIVEHLAFASILSDVADDPYFDAARNWLLATARVWKHEATNKPDASKAYAVLRVMKALAVGYDMLYDRLDPKERAEIRDAMVSVCGEYYIFFQDPSTAGAGYNKHHGSVDAAPFGVVALALLDEVPDASQWLGLMIEKHVKYLLPYALTPSGTSDQSSNFWASTMHYRIFFMDALRRVTGRDLFREHPDALPGRIALAAVAGKQSRDLKYNEMNRSVLFGPCYGQIDYWSPVLLFLAREQRRPIYQHLARWDESMGSLQRTRYITPSRKEELLFALGGYVYVWYDETVTDEIESDVPRSFEFPEQVVNEAYIRSSYEPGGIVVGMLKGKLIVHAGGQPVLNDLLGVSDINKPAEPVDEMLVADDGRQAMIRCVGPKQFGIGEQRVELTRPSRLTIRRETTRDVTWWHAGRPQQQGNNLTWPDGTTVEVTRGSIATIDPNGFKDEKVHFGGMKFADPQPIAYPIVTVRPDRDVLQVTITTPEPR